MFIQVFFIIWLFSHLHYEPKPTSLPDLLTKIKFQKINKQNDAELIISVWEPQSTR